MAEENPEVELRAKVQSLWVRPAVWKCLGIVKDDIQGTWSRVMEIFLEKMISSGLMTEGAIKKIREIAEAESINIAPDSGWNNSFQTPESWPMAAGHLKTIAEETEKLGPLLEELVEAVEDHAIAMMDIEDNEETEENFELE